MGAFDISRYEYSFSLFLYSFIHFLFIPFCLAEKREWLEMRTIFPYPKARQLHSCSRIDGTDSMCVIGGVGIEDINDIWIFDARK